MTNPEKTEQAAWNNAAWCDAICRAQGHPGEFQDAAWIHPAPAPRFYPNVVTLGGVGQQDAHRECVLECLPPDMSQVWSVKDSFQTLELSSLGFNVLFEAQWIAWPEGHPAPKPPLDGVRWKMISDAPALATWEAAWSGQSSGPGIFRPMLLADADVAVIAAYRDNRIVAGAVANRASGVVGLSNIFVPATDSSFLRSGCVAQAMEAFPDLPLVGYESGSELAAMEALGFETVGPLRVWARGG